MPLIIPVMMLTNTPGYVLCEHILENSRNIKKWIKFEPPHDEVALLCGSGPSIKDNLQEIKERQKSGALVFALNAAAKYLNDNGIFPDYQVMIDGKKESIALIGPAKDHIFSSTVDPECFNQKPHATLFQLQLDDEDFDKQIHALAQQDYTQIMTAVSVGVVALGLVYVMGFREVHCYGYDSSHADGESHIVRQKMNDVVPCMEVEYAGKKYLTSFPMKLQAERFMQVMDVLRHEGVNTEVHGKGLLPDMAKTPFEKLTEKEKYVRMWSMLSYRDLSPAEEIYSLILEKLYPIDGAIIDFGCGTGRAAAKITERGHTVIMLDFAPNCLSEEAAKLPFFEMDLTEPIPFRAKQGYCVDVMEHIPPEHVETVIKNIMTAAEKVFFQISAISDKCGITIGHELHLSIAPKEWWENKFKELGYRVLWSEKLPFDSRILVSR